MLKAQRFSNDVFALHYPTVTWSLVRVRVCIFYIFTFCQHYCKHLLYFSLHLFLLPLVLVILQKMGHNQACH